MSFLTSPQLWEFLAGIAIFLYALDVIEEIAKSGGAAFQKRIQSMTSTKLRSVLLGIGLVNLLQSSHAVSLLILALVGSGYIALNHAIAVVIGMNIGSVFMEALIGLFGLGFNMKVLVMPMIGIGGLGALFVKKYRNIFLCVMCIGLVFLGLEFMKDSIKDLKSLIDLSSYAHLHRSIFVPIGLLAVILTQSSSALTIIAMTTLFEGIITLPMASSLLMGAYIGSTTTALFVAMTGSSAIKKQVALSHFLFNLTTCLIFALVFSSIMHVIIDVRGFGSDAPWFAGLTKSSVNGLIVFFALFKAIGGIIHMPFINFLTKTLQKVAPSSSEATLGIQHIDHHIPLATQLQIIHHDIEKHYSANFKLIEQRFRDPKTYNEQIYYKQKAEYDTLFKFLVIFPFEKIKENGTSGIKLLNCLQETMQALKLCKDSMRSMNNIIETQDHPSNHYLKELYSLTDEYFTFMNTQQYEAAGEQIEVIKGRDEIQMQNILSKGKPISNGIAELMEIHSHIHSSLAALHEAREELGA